MPIVSAANPRRADSRQLLEELAGGFQQSLSLMTMREWVLRPSATDSTDQPEWLQWRQLFTGPVSGVVWISASETTWKRIVDEVGSATGGGAETKADWKTTCAEVCAQASARLIRTLEGMTGGPSNVAAGVFEIGNGEPGESIQHEFSAGEERPLLARFGMVMKDGAADSDPPVPAARHSASLDLLMEVELPVSVSFGRTQMRLKDAVRLSTGSIVELNKSLSEPVEIIVNNCVIARGEVVVVEGNYGVRIKEIVSREERLRTLF